MKGIKPGDIALFQDKAGATRQALILQTDGTECIYTLLHEFRKGGASVAVGGKYCDPSELGKRSEGAFISTILGADKDTLHIVRSAVAKSVGLDVTQAGLSAELRRALQENERLEKENQGLRVYKMLYEQFLKQICDRISPETDENDIREAIRDEKNRRGETKRAENREKYGKIQAYIGVKCKEMNMSFATLDRLIGCVQSDGKTGTGAVSHWIRGDSRAQWDKLERIFPGLRAEAEEWAKRQTEAEPKQR